jgi:hypothetical protein
MEQRYVDVVRDERWIISTGCNQWLPRDRDRRDIDTHEGYICVRSKSGLPAPPPVTPLDQESPLAWAEGTWHKEVYVYAASWQIFRINRYNRQPMWRVRGIHYCKTIFISDE